MEEEEREEIEENSPVEDERQINSEEEEELEMMRQTTHGDFNVLSENQIENQVLVLQERQLPEQQLMGLTELHLDQEENTRRIVEFASKKVFPNIDLKEIVDYYSDETEHPFCSNFSMETNDYKPSFNVSAMKHYDSQNLGGFVYEILQRILFLSDENMTKQSANKHGTLIFEKEGFRPKFSNVGRKEIPSAKILYYCYSSNHERNTGDGKSFLFFPSNYCTCCKKDIHTSDYVAVFDLREQIHLKLLSFPKEVLSHLLHQNQVQRNMKDVNFDENTVIHDVLDSLLNSVIRKNGFYDTCDIGFIGMFNTDAVALERKCDVFQDVWGIWLAFLNLPIERRYKRENMVLLGLYTSKNNIKLSTSTLDPFLEQINIAYQPWKMKIGEKNIISRLSVLGSSLDGVEIPRVFNIMAHNSYFQCCSCDFCGKWFNKMYFYRYSYGIEPNSARITRDYRRCLLNRLQTYLDKGIFKGNSRFVDEIKTFFILSISFSDSLHVVYEGILKTLLDNIEKFNSKMFENLVSICQKLKHPRIPGSSINTNIAGKVIFFFSITSV